MEKAKQRDKILRFITENKLPVGTSSRVYSYFRLHGRVQRTRVHEADIKGFDAMPETLRMTLHTEVYLPVLLPHPFFQHLGGRDEDALIKIAHGTTSDMTLYVHQELFVAGTEATKMWFVRAGVADYFHRERPNSKPRQLKPGTYFCEMVLWMPWQNRGRLTCSGIVELVAVDHSTFLSIVSRSCAVGLVQAYAQIFIKELLRTFCSEKEFSDIWSDFNKKQQMAQRAFETADIKGRVEAKASFRTLQSRMGLQFSVMRGSRARSESGPGSLFSQGSVAPEQGASFLARLRRRLG